ncbi:MAG: hypothetical protein AAFV29_22985, partial [Myxococcota bacterium]
MSTRKWGVAAENANQRWSSREGRLLRLTDADGTVGWGEASPLPGYIEETVESVDRAFADWRAGWTQLQIDEGGDAARQIDAIVTRVASGGSPSSAFAIETALWDVWARRQSRPLAEVWGASADTRVSTAMLVDVLSPRAWPSTPSAVVKMKVGRPGQWREELQGLRQWHARFSDVEVRLDANRAFALAAAADRLHDLQKLSEEGLMIDFIEEPSMLPWPSTSLPLAQDESLRTGEVLPHIAAVVV